MVLWNDCEASIKPRADVSMWKGALFFATGVDLCHKCHITVNLVDQYITHSYMCSHESS